MKISKYLHSCLLVQDEKTVLIDPGIYTFESKALDLRFLDTLDYLLITHEHSDHMYLPFIKEIVKKFPEIKIFSNSSVKNILEREDLNVEVQGNEFIEIQEFPHERIFTGSAPQNVLFKIFQRLTHPGDSLSFSTTTEILALPVQAPWGSTTQAVEKAISLKPRVVIPIHDWHWNDQARAVMYQRLRDYFQSQNIDFLGLDTGQTLKV